MKKVIIFIFVNGLFLWSCAQKVQPPKKVSDAFSEKFSMVEKLKWDQEESEWEAEFRKDHTKMSASFDSEGNWLETETSLKEDEIPEMVSESIANNYPGWKTEEIERVEKPGFNGYEAEIEKGESEMELVISDTGEITEKKESKDND